MKDKNFSPTEIEHLDARIEAMLDNADMVEDQLQELDSEQEALLSIAEKIISHNKEYTGSPSPTAQQRLTIMTIYRSTFQKKDGPSPKPRIQALFHNRTFRWAAIVGVCLFAVIGILLASPADSATILPGAAGQHGALLPLIVLGLIGVTVVLYFVFLRKK